MRTSEEILKYFEKHGWQYVGMNFGQPCFYMSKEQYHNERGL